MVHTYTEMTVTISAGGSVVLNEGEESEQTIRLEDEDNDGIYVLNVYDGQDLLISSENAEQIMQFINIRQMLTVS